MIGDDIVSDVGGAQACGIRGVQVRTGKFRYHYTERAFDAFHFAQLWESRLVFF